jgi:4-hydroxybenzoate polyprenyltransferase
VKIIVWTEALRLTHWIKSGFCLAAIFFHGSAADYKAWMHVLPVVLGFSLISSAGYLVNDILNREEDRHHPRKRKRALASGKITIPAAWTAVALLTAGAFVLLAAFYGRGPVLAVVGGYYLLSWLYSLMLRGLPLVDVLVIATGFAARVAAGAYALQSYDATAYPTAWLLTCTYFLALLLGFGKRKGEWLLLERTHKTMGETRKALR